MTRQEIVKKLTGNHKLFIDFIISLEDEKFVVSNNDKWSSGQQLDHIFRSVKPLTQVLLLPKILVKLKFGKSNRPSRTYEALVSKYLTKLENGGKAGGRFVPETIQIDQKEILAASLSNLIIKLSSQILSFSEKELDTYILPHPLLGKLTLREIMYFAIFHVEHHLEITKRNLNFKDK